MLLFQVPSAGRSQSLNKGSQTNIPLGLAQQGGVFLVLLAAKDAVHLLETGILGLGQEEPNPEDADEEEGSEENVGAPLPGLQHGRHKEGNGEVVDPVAGGADGDTLGTD